MSEPGTVAPSLPAAELPREKPARNYLPAALILVPLFLFAVATLSRFLKPSEPPLPVMGTVPEFSLTRSDGKTVTLESLRGQIWIADFIFTRCQGTCGIMSSRMLEIQNKTAGTKDLKLVSFSVDPLNDSPAVLAEYAKLYQSDPERWYFLTGPREEIFSLAEKGFKLSAVPDGDGLVTHSDRLVIVDAQGRIRGTYSGTEEKVCEALLKDLVRLYRGSKR